MAGIAAVAALAVGGALLGCAGQGSDPAAAGGDGAAVETGSGRDGEAAPGVRATDEGSGQPRAVELVSDPLAEAFLANATYLHPALSPDGSRLAAIRSRGGVDEVVVIELDEDGAGPAVVLTERRKQRGFAASRGITDLGWAGDETLGFVIETALRDSEDGVPERRARREDSSGRRQRGIGLRARKTRLHATNLEGRSRYLGQRWQDAPASQYQHEVIDWLPDDPHHLLLSYEGKALRVDVRNGARMTLVRELAEASSWWSDHRGVVRAGTSTRGWDRGLALHGRVSERDPWRALIDYDPYRDRGFWFAGFHPDPTRLYVFSDLASDHAGLYEFDLARGALAERVRTTAKPAPGSSATAILQSGLDDRLLAIERCASRCSMAFVDEAFAERWATIEAKFPERGLAFEGRSRSEERWLARVESDVAAPELWLVELASARVQKIADLHPALADRPLAPMQSVRFQARDGLPLEGYLSRPLGAEGPGPAIVLLHDGPDERAWWGFDPVVQYLVARGFTVVQPNYRGSIGYGRLFEQQAYGRWGTAVVRDVVDAAGALVAAGFAQRGRIGVYGTGLGGYLALQALVEAPEAFAAGASFGAVTDLPRMLSDNRGFIGREASDAVVYLGGRPDDGWLARVSPVDNAGRIRAPVLLGHGSEDPTFPEKHADAMADALRDAGKRFDSFRYEGATDRFLDDRHRIDFHSRLAAFFERHLGPGGTVRAAGPSGEPEAP